MSGLTKAQRKEERRQEREAAQQAAAQQAARRRRLQQLGGAIAAAAVVVIVLIVVSSSGTSDKPTKKSGETVAGQTEVAARFAGLPQAGIALGRQSAPVTLVELADLQCPFCADFARDGLPGLVENEVKAGTLRIEFRSMAFVGDDSTRMADAVAGAAQQNLAWPVIDLLYINQGQENSGFATDDFLRETLGAVRGLDVDKALADGAAEGPKAIAEAKAIATSAGIDSTPSFLIGKTGGTLSRLEVSKLDGAEIRARVKELAGS